MVKEPKVTTVILIHLILSSAIIYHTTFSHECPQGDRTNGRYYIKNAMFVNTTVERYSKLQSTQCMWKFSVKLQSDKIPKLICLVYDLGRGPALKDSRLLVYDSNFRNTKVVRPLMKLAPFLFSGSVVGDPDSAVFGTIARGGFLGQLRIGRQVFHIEKAIKYFPPTKYYKGPSAPKGSRGGADATIQVLFASNDLHVLCTHRDSRGKRDDQYLKIFKHVSSEDNNENYSDFDELDEDTILSEAYVHATDSPSVTQYATAGNKKGRKILEQVTNILQNSLHVANAPSVSNNSSGPGTEKVNKKEDGRHKQGANMESEQLTLTKGDLPFTPASYDPHSPVKNQIAAINSSVDIETTTNLPTTGYGDSFSDLRKPSAHVEAEYEPEGQEGVKPPSDSSSIFTKEYESNNEAHHYHQSQFPLPFVANGGLIWKLTLGCDYEFYRDGGDENIGITVGRMLHLFYLAEWVIRSTDWNGDQLPDNLGFKIENVAMEIEPSDNNGGAERFTSLVKDCRTPFILAFSSKFTPIQHVFSETRKNDSGVFQGGCDNETKIVTISVVDSKSKELPDSVIAQRIINAILTFLGSYDEGIKQKCEDNSSANETRRWELYGINECVRRFTAGILTSVCSTKPDVAFCGNGILEAGEECDCGSLSTCWMSQGGCCNPRGNALSQCKFASDAECFDPTGLCCDLDSCQRRDISHEGLSCESPPVCAVVANLNESVVKNVSSSCGALVAGNIAQIQTECIESLCQSNECTRLGLSECICPAESMTGQTEMHCVTCCQLPEKQCLAAEAATESVLKMLSKSYENYRQENFLLSSTEVLQEFMDSNKNFKAFWDKLKDESVTKTSEGTPLRSPVDENAMNRRLCLIDFQPETCVNVSFLRWPVGKLCVVHGAVSTCTADRLCKKMYQNSMTTTREAGQMYQMIRRDDNILSAGSTMSPLGLLVTHFLVFVFSGCTGHLDMMTSEYE